MNHWLEGRRRSHDVPPGWIGRGRSPVDNARWRCNSCSAIFADKTFDRKRCIDAVEGKLFGLGSESYVVSSHEFCSIYAQSRGGVPCLDLGHYHPTESVADNVSALMQFHPRISCIPRDRFGGTAITSLFSTILFVIS